MKPPAPAAPLPDDDEGAAWFAHRFDVSCETSAKLSAHLRLLAAWNAYAGLVSTGDLKRLWRRHCADGVAVALAVRKLGLKPQRWADLGCGGGFPGLTMAALPPPLASGGNPVLIEANRRKAAFLHCAAAAMDVQVEIVNARLEDWKPPPEQAPDLIVTRAVAPLERLLRLVETAGFGDVPLIAVKGARHREERRQASRSWEMEIVELPNAAPYAKQEDGAKQKDGADHEGGATLAVLSRRRRTRPRPQRPRSTPDPKDSGKRADRHGCDGESQ